MNSLPTGGGLPSELSAPTVIAIDDDPMVLLMISKTLANAGMVCRTATTGTEGLRLIDERRPDLVLLDLMLLGEDGFTICKEIRRAWTLEELPVVMVTGLEDLASINAAYDAGANDFLTKPLHWKHLPYRIQHVLNATRAFQSLQESTRMLRSVFAVHPDSILTVDAKGLVTLVRSGLRPEAGDLHPVLGTLEELLPGALCTQVRARCQAALAAPAEVLSLEFTHPFDKDPRFWEARFIASSDDRVLVMVRDITQHKSFERQIRHMAYHDALTGLWNRHAFNSALARVVEEIQRSAGTPYPISAAILYLDLDNFKRVNDTLGHALGDELLKTVAGRISEILRPSDVLARADNADVESVARIGGDEFCLILKSIASPVNAGRVARRILDALRQSVILEGHELVVTPSIGIALVPQDGTRPGHPAEERRPGHVRGQGRRAEPLPVLRPFHELPAAGALRPRSRACAGAWPTAPSTSSSSPRSTPAPRRSWAWRPCCAGTTRRWAPSPRRASSRWPRRPGSSWSWANSSSGKPSPSPSPSRPTASPPSGWP